VLQGEPLNSVIERKLANKAVLVATLKLFHRNCSFEKRCSVHVGVRALPERLLREDKTFGRVALHLGEECLLNVAL